MKKIRGKIFEEKILKFLFVKRKIWEKNVFKKHFTRKKFLGTKL